MTTLLNVLSELEPAPVLISLLIVILCVSLLLLAIWTV